MPETVKLAHKERAALVRVLRARRELRHLAGQRFAAIALASQPARWPERTKALVGFVEARNGVSVERRIEIIAGVQCLGCGRMAYGLYGEKLCYLCETEVHKWGRRFGLYPETEKSKDLAMLGWLATRLRVEASLVSQGVDLTKVRRRKVYDTRDHLANLLFRLPALIERHPYGVRVINLAAECGINNSQASRLMIDMDAYGLAEIVRRSDQGAAVLFPVGHKQPAVRITPKQALIMDYMRGVAFQGVARITLKTLSGLTGLGSVSDKLYSLERKGLVRQIKEPKRAVANEWEPAIYRINKGVTYTVWTPPAHLAKDQE